MLCMERSVARDCENKFQDRKRSAPSPNKIRSAITNGTRVLADLDHRGAWARRLKDLIAGYLSDLGEHTSEAKRALVRRAAMLTLQLELLEQRFAQNEAGEALASELEVYQRCTNTLRRTLEALGLKRRPQEVPDESDAIAREFLQEYHNPSEAAR